MTLRLNLVNLAWDQIAGSTSYEIQLDGVKVATAGPKAKTTKITIPEGAEHRVTIKALPSGKVQEAKFEWASVATPPPPPPPDLTPGPPIVISAGGTHTGWWVSSAGGTGGAAVRVTTSQPVIIEDSIIENTNTTEGWGAHSVQSGAQITFRRCTFIGAVGNVGRALNTGGSSRITVENCTFVRTGGIYLQGLASGAQVLVSKNKATNITGNMTTALRQFCQINASPVLAAAVIEWNEILNTFGQSVIEDCISIHASSNVVVRNNFIRGGYPPSAGAAHSGMGILLADNGGSDNVAHDNQIVAYTNGGIGITDGANNHCYNNRVISDGRLDDGTELWATNQGMICYTTTPGRNNTLYDNYIGWMQGQRFGHPLSRSDYYCPTADNNVEADNTFAYGNHSTPMTKADEDAEWTIWQAKIAANGITIGA